MEPYFVTVFTPTYNRAHTLPRVFDGLKKQSYRHFEWIIVDDGSLDNTRAVVDSFLEEAPFFPVIYRHQENSGKHVAINRALEIARGEFFIILDSDDSCTEDALEAFLAEWDKIPKDQRSRFYGISCRCCDLDGNIIGTNMSEPFIDSHDLEFKYVHRITGELWGMTRTEVMRANPFPEEKGLHFYPENVYWNNMGRKFRCRYINRALRYYINDTDNALTSSKLLSPLRETFFMRVHFINECWDYARYAPKKFLFQIIGLSRDGLEFGYRFGQICCIPNTLLKKILTVLFYPAGYLLYIRSHRSQS